VLLYNCASLVNFAQGDLVMFGGYLLAAFAPVTGTFAALVMVARGDGAVLAHLSARHLRSIADRAARDFTPFVVTHDWRVDLHEEHGALDLGCNTGVA